MANGDAATAWEWLKDVGLLGLGASAIYWLGYGLRGIRDAIKNLDTRHTRSSKRNDEAHEKIDNKVDGVLDTLDEHGNRITVVETTIDIMCDGGDK